MKLPISFGLILVLSLLPGASAITTNRSTAAGGECHPCRGLHAVDGSKRD